MAWLVFLGLLSGLSAGCAPPVYCDAPARGVASLCVLTWNRCDDGKHYEARCLENNKAGTTLCRCFKQGSEGESHTFDTLLCSGDGEGTTAQIAEGCGWSIDDQP